MSAARVRFVLLAVNPTEKIGMSKQHKIPIDLERETEFRVCCRVDVGHVLFGSAVNCIYIDRAEEIPIDCG